eukprot:CAMPEP_0172312422 /NCGR_PEP_ID=MMETSP1058-20130122/17463_1 /TAXON_ID=83371 /ORGANISM="Detonula confervacea, Strain CCMP 353" /LENGTH=974 /DNA_ID=CAMNT_0013025871 /DNA_START=207 /DNA_END=3131 /DNA_ORIENTATION=+
MPADKKKSSSGEGSQKKEKPVAKDAKQPAAAAKDAAKQTALKLHATAKEFVPSAAILKATATSWKPTDDAPKKPAAAASSESSGSGKAPHAKNGANSGKESAAAAAKSPAAEAVKQAPKAPAPTAAAWGSKPSAAIKKAAPARPQQNPAARNQNQQQQQGRGGRDSGKWGERSGKKQEQGGGGGGNSGGSWARTASKPGSAGRDAGGQGRDGGGNRDRQSQSRGGNRPGGDQGRGDDNNSSWSRGKAVPVDLMEPGEGKTDAEKAVKRITVAALLAMRADHIAAPSSWEEEEGAAKPPPACIWDTPTRITEIEEATKAARIGGDVSQKEKSKRKGGKSNPNDTAPALEDCKPLEVNEGTRWKPNIMNDKGAEAEVEEAESKEDVLRKAMLILNKLSLTKFDKLSDEFIACGIGRDVECLTGAVSLIVTYAQEQQHFSAMYAGLCLKLANTPMEGIDEGSKKGKKFKKILLTRCQSEFETSTETKIKAATKDDADDEVIAYHAGLIKKHYLGHMRFIGELYKGDLISIKIMLFCLPALLKGETEESSNDIDEEKVECFSKLMTVIGSSLEQQSGAMKSIGKADAADSLADCWRIVEVMAGKRKGKAPEVSNRIKFMLQDLLEMKAKGWVTRRKEETAKTLAQIHKEVEKEERAAARKSSSSANLRGQSKGSMRRGASSGDVRVLDKKQTKPQVDNDGFVSVAASKGFNRSGSMPVMARTQSKEGFQKYSTRGSVASKPEGSGRRPSQGKFAVLNESGPRKNSKKGSSDKTVEKAAAPAEEEKPKINYLSPDQCGEKAKNFVKEYFVGGDTDDAVLSIHELVGAGNEGSLERGTKVVEQAVLMLLEMKQEHIDKFVGLYLRCAKENKIEGDSFVLGLNDPLEFLNDVAIDAPLAIPHLASIVAELVKADVIPFNFLLNSPEYFRTDQHAADFGAKVMKKIGGDVIASEDYIEVIEKLMTCEDKAKHSSASDLIAEA